MYHCDACPKRFHLRGRWHRHYWLTHAPFSQQRKLTWEKWADEARERDVPQQCMYRPSITLPVDLMAKVDRVAAAQGMDRSQLVEYMLEHHLASWREMPA